MKKINKLAKIIYILTIITMIVVIFNNYTYAISVPAGLSQVYTATDYAITTIGSQIIYVAEIGFFAAAIIILMVAGIQYMMAAPDAKAEIKKKMIYLAIGGVLLFAAGGLIKIIGTLAMNI